MSGAKNRKRRYLAVVGTTLLLNGFLAGGAWGATRRAAASEEPAPVAVGGELSSMLPSAEERLLEQIQTEKLGFRRAAATRAGEGGGNGLASSLPGAAANPDASVPDLSLSSLDFWLGGTVPRWILLSGLLLGLSFLTASLALYLRGRRSKAKARSASVRADVAPKIAAPSVSSETDARVLAAREQAARADLERRALQERETMFTEARPASDGVDLPPRRFARYATLDEEPTYGTSPHAPAPMPSSQAGPPRHPMPAPMSQQPPIDAPPSSPARRRPADKKQKRTKLDRRISLLEGSMLQILSSVDRLASRMETLADPVADEREENQAPVEAEPVELGPWRDPSLALPPSHRSVHPEPFFARLAAQRAQSQADPGRVVESTPMDALTAMPAPAPEKADPQPAGPRPSAPRTRVAPPVGEPAPIASIRTTKPAALPRPVPVVQPPAVRAPTATPALSAGRLPDPTRVREFVLRLARDGWSGDRIARETKIPARDIALILKSAGRQTGSAETAGIRR